MKALLLAEIDTKVFLAPGTEPDMYNKLLSKSISNISRFFIVNCSPPYLPGIFFPLKTFPGVEPAPMDPGARCLSDCPWVLGPPLKCHLFTTPVKPLPFDFEVIFKY